MPKLTPIVLVVVLSIAALLWLYAQPDPAPEFPEVSGPSGQLAKVRVRPVPAAADATTTGDLTDLNPDAEVAALGAQSSAETAIPITSGFEDLLEPSPRTRSRSPSATIERHRSLLAEVRDAEWAERIESTIRTFIESHLSAEGFDTHRIELPVIECRTTLCEVQATGVAADANSPRGVQSLAAQIVQGPLASEFSNSSTESFALPDGRIGYLVFFTRHRSR